MAKYEDQLARMNFLMEYRAPEKKAVSNIEFHANGADGKVYGILKEGTKLHSYRHELESIVRINRIFYLFFIHY